MIIKMEKLIGTESAKAIDYIDSIVDDEHAPAVEEAFKRIIIIFTALGLITGWLISMAIMLWITVIF